MQVNLMLTFNLWLKDTWRTLDTSTTQHDCAHKFDVGASEDLDSIVVGNHKESKGNDEISTMYMDTGESYNKDYIMSTFIYPHELQKTLDWI